MECNTESLANSHWHGREPGPVMKSLIQYGYEGGADTEGAQPNTDKGLTTAHQVKKYIEKARELTPSHISMNYIPFVMITEDTTEKMIDDCVEAGIEDGKIYPKNRTTKSENGVERYGRLIPKAKHCGKAGMRLHSHPEHPSMLFGNRDAEYSFLPIQQMFLEETVNEGTIFFWEHGTDARATPFWKKWAKESERFYVTLTAHHMAENEDGAFGDVRSVCKPPIKTENDRQGIVQLVSEDHPWVMAGLDDAFHPGPSKHTQSGRCACGSFTTPFGLILYAHALDELLMRPGGEEVFVNFTSRNLRRVMRLPVATETIVLVQEPFKIPLVYEVGMENALPFWAGQEIKWRIKSRQLRSY